MKNPPPLLIKLFNLNDGKKSLKFRVRIRLYNLLFALTSLGGKVEKYVNNGTYPYVFHFNGQNYHWIGSLLHIHRKKPPFALLYIYDTKNEIGCRIDANVEKDRKNDVYPNIAIGLMEC